jgi:hypothetical protein
MTEIGTINLLSCNPPYQSNIIKRAVISRNSYENYKSIIIERKKERKKAESVFR